ncbi:PQQ-binding-like beta-propeller repeat protein [Candidatus Poribacteria bacterium]|nr:PQQ-binding-like beta-propeller repeat protein [Candidatus Poribacteria bacterium]MYB64020.1 PQQ-binding-like beta-propeller repeat protein [Candidatus Poribacteria bacterium]MYF56533.1 PQQ-binding-like beta-propeller repeat protein [Candidatus Poribacteria bacterium]MYI94499.1 PQQ-binding-like beta-propeller repeat protein [Candidatus Poribacteria bacterium]
MKKTVVLFLCVCAVTILTVYTSRTIADNHSAKVEQPLDFEKNWHYWRGPLATGEAVHANPPITWNETENIRWKVPIPGLGHATPIIWEDRIYIQTAIQGEMVNPETTEEENPPEESQQQRRRGRRGNRNRTLPTLKYDLLALNRSDGSVAWQKTLRESKPHEGIHTTASFSSNSPITDGEHIYAYFGSRGLYCLDMEGNIKWEKDIGIMHKRNAFGEGSCPMLHGNTIVILQDHERQSFITALDKRTGDEIWKVDREEPTTWTSPIVVDYNGKSQVIVPATNRTRSYDLTNGDLIWECGGLTSNVVPTPMYQDGHIYVLSGHRGSSIQSINLELASGDITGTEAVVWQYGRDTPYVPSALLSGDIIYFMKGYENILTAMDRNSGKVLYGPQRVQGVTNVYASIVGAAGRVYIASRNGTVAVIKEGPDYEMLALNILDDSFNASPAIVGSELYLRGTQHLYCIAE